MAELNYGLVPLDRDGRESITQQIVNLVQKNMELEVALPGQRLPTERELAAELGVARGTVKSAYKKLEQMNLVVIRQGSGTFVIRDEELSRKLNRKQAVSVLTGAVAALQELGLSPTEMRDLFDLCLEQGAQSSVQIAIIYDCSEILQDFKQQLSYLEGVSVSVFVLESITQNDDPESLLRGFDLILAPSKEYHKVVRLLPGLADKVIEGAIATKSETLVSLTSLPRDSRIGIICRTNAFLSIVKENLIAFGFREENISSYFENDYTVKTYFPGGINVLIAFADAHIFHNPAFGFRNEEFWQKGGSIIIFKHQIERGTLIYIENLVRRLLSKKGRLTGAQGNGTGDW